MSLPRALRDMGSRLPLVYVFKRIWEHASISNLPPREVADEFAYVFPCRADFQLARLTYVLFDFGLRFSINSPDGAQNIADIVEAAAYAIEENHDCRDDVLRVVSAAKFSTFVHIGYEKHRNNWRIPTIRSAVWRLFKAAKGQQIARPRGLETEIFNKVLLPSSQMLMAELMYKGFKPTLPQLNEIQLKTRIPAGFSIRGEVWRASRCSRAPCIPAGSRTRSVKSVRCAKVRDRHHRIRRDTTASASKNPAGTSVRYRT